MAGTTLAVTVLQGPSTDAIITIPTKSSPSEVARCGSRMPAAPNGTAALVSRCESAGLVTRKPDAEDRRQVQVHLTPKGERCLLKLAAEHKAHYGSFGWVFGDTGE